MATNRIVKLGLEKRAHDLRTEGKSEDIIAATLSAESKQEIKRSSVFRYFKAIKSIDPIVKHVEERTGVVAAAVQERLDTLQQLRDINQDTLEILKDAKGDAKQKIKGNPGLALAAIQRIEKQLELQAKLLGDLPTQPTINITVVENQFTEFKIAVVGVMCPECQRRVAELLRTRVGP
jgi:hypothetical protein